MRTPTLLIFGIMLALFPACDFLENLKPDKEEKETPCPQISAEVVPSAVKDSLIARYPGSATDKWFNKDNNTFVALIINNAQKSFISFDPNGVFLKSEADDQNGNNDDNNNDHQDNDSGCSCDTDND